MISSKFINKLFNNKIVILIVVILGIRALLNYSVPLMDKTEARYAEIARIMNETKNWITPQIDYGIPFWGKPPISSWMSAVSIYLFGENEFFLRLPYFFLSIILFFLTLKYSKPKNKLITGLREVIRKNTRLKKELRPCKHWSVQKRRRKKRRSRKSRRSRRR